MTYVSINNAIIHRLNSVAAISALVSGRIYPEFAPQKPQYPFIIADQLDDVPYDDIKGRAGLFDAQFDFLCFARSANDAMTLGEEVRKALQGYTGTNLGVSILGVRLEKRWNEFQTEIEDFTTILRFSIWHVEEIVPVGS